MASEKDQPWSVTNAFHFTNRFVEARLWAARLACTPAKCPCPATMPRLSGTLVAGARRETTFAPSYHFVTDLGTDEAWTNLPGGPSESRVSGFYKNDIRRWRLGEYKQLSGKQP